MDSSEYKFIVAGHTYGAWSQSVYPAPLFIDFVDSVDQSKYNFCVLLGDIYRSQEAVDLYYFKTRLLNRFKIPVFNAIGNHDLGKNIPERKVQNYPKYHEEFTKNTFYSFNIRQIKYIVIDSELSNNNGSIDGEQLLFLKSELENLDPYKSVIIFCHKELYLFDNNFKKDVLPLMQSAGKKVNQLFFITGDMAKKSDNFYSYHDEINNIKFVHHHLMDSRKDVIVEFTVNEKDEINLDLISLISHDKVSFKNSEQLPIPISDKVESPSLYTLILSSKKVLIIGFILGAILSCIILWSKKRFLS